MIPRRIGILVGADSSETYERVLQALENNFPGVRSFWSEPPRIGSKRQVVQKYWGPDVADLTGCDHLVFLLGNGHRILQNADHLAGKLNSSATIVSLLENISLETLARELQTSRITRIATTPFLCSPESLIFWYDNLKLQTDEAEWLERSLAQLGTVLNVESEAQLEAAQRWINQIVSGVRKGMSLTIEHGVNKGLTESEAQTLAAKLWLRADRLWPNQPSDQESDVQTGR